MAERYRSGQPLHHPNDVTWIDQLMHHGNVWRFLDTWSSEMENMSNSRQIRTLLMECILQTRFPWVKREFE